MIHDLLHIENEDLITLSKKYSKRKKKKGHIKDFEEEIFKRFNQLRRINGVMEIEKKRTFRYSDKQNLAVNKFWKMIL